MKFEVTLKKSKDTTGTHVYTGPRQDDQGRPMPTTSLYLNKEALNGQAAPATIKVTIEA